MLPEPLRTLQDQKRFHEEIKRAYRWLDIDVDPKAACLYWAMATLIAAERNRLREDFGWDFQLQGGTASFVRLADEDDDGHEDTHNAFSYVFEDSQVTRTAIREGRLPEMHVWVACAVNVIVDVTTGFQPAQCLARGKMPWTAPKPPPFVMFGVDDPPSGLFYAPSRPGTILAHAFAEDAMRERKNR